MADELVFPHMISHFSTADTDNSMTQAPPSHSVFAPPRQADQEVAQ
jgi:hypothetical protein